MKIKEVGAIRLNNANYYVEDYEWFAPGVGVVRAILKERKDADPNDPSAGDPFSRLELTMDLESFTKAAR